MATIASQVVFHPLVSQGLKFGGTSLGRDKTYRALQYFSRFLAWYLLTKGNKIEAARWSALKAHLGTARKLLRLGKPMEHLQAALKASISGGPALENITTVARQLGYFGYLSYDAIVWAATIKLINLPKETAARLQKRAFQLWFAGILFSLVHGALKSRRLAKEAKALKSTQTWGEKDLADEAARETKFAQITAARKSNVNQLTLDVFDVWIPASGAGLIDLSEGLLGIAGLVSSLLGAKTQWQAVNGKK